VPLPPRHRDHWAGRDSGAAGPLGSKPSDVTALEHFLTARWMLFSIVGARPVSARACHQPWPLHRAQAQVLEDNLLTTVGPSVRQGEPLVHHSPGVDVAIGRPEPQLAATRRVGVVARYRSWRASRSLDRTPPHRAGRIPLRACGRKARRRVRAHAP
jgi:hypothetical protein